MRKSTRGLSELEHSLLKKDIIKLKNTVKNMQQHIDRLENTLSEIPFTRDWFRHPQPISLEDKKPSPSEWR